MQAAPKVAMSDDFLKSLLKVGKKEQQGVMELLPSFGRTPGQLVSTMRSSVMQQTRTCALCVSTRRFAASC